MHASALMFFILLCFASNTNIIRGVEAVWMTLPTSGTRCVMEEIKNNVVVLGDYFAVSVHNSEDDPVDTPILISVSVTSPYGDSLHHSEDVMHGQFAFTTSIAGEYTACFWVDKKHQKNETVTVGLDWKIGIATKDWESVAKKEKIEGVELEVVKLTEVVKQLQSNLFELIDREFIMREVSQKTNARVVWFSTFSLGVCIVTSFSQLWYLKCFFRKKKLI